MVPAILIITLFVFIVALVKKSPEPAPTNNETPIVVEPSTPTTTPSDLSSPPSPPDLSSPRSEQGSTTSTTATTSPREAAPPPPTAPTRVAFTIEADDASFSQTEIRVTRGATVSLTFRVRTTGVYYGGLDVRSTAFNTGTIPPGGIKTVSFIANSSFDFSSYWPLTNTLKTTGHVIVE